MKDRILRLCRRLDKFTLDEISTITEDINESVLELLLLTLVQEEKLIFKDNIYLYNKEQGCNKQRLPQFFQHHSKTDTQALKKKLNQKFHELQIQIWTRLFAKVRRWMLLVGRICRCF